MMAFKIGDRLAEDTDSVLERIDLSANYLQQVGFIDFALIFGSYAEGRARNLSDVDIGIFTNREISLIDIGLLTANLESVVKLKVDLLTLNDLYSKNSVLCYEIISKGKILFCKDENVFVNFKKNALLYFMDMKDMIDMVNKAFNTRLFQGRFGEQGYVGKA